jgi:hypothetical protein
VQRVARAHRYGDTARCRRTHRGRPRSHARSVCWLTVSARAAPLCGTHTGGNGSFAKICCPRKRERIACQNTHTTLTGLTKQGVHRSDTALDIPAKSLCKGRRRACTSCMSGYRPTCASGTQRFRCRDRRMAQSATASRWQEKCSTVRRPVQSDARGASRAVRRAATERVQGLARQLQAATSHLRP